MPIIIPSKNIYMINYNKVVDNHIKSVDVSIYNTEKTEETISFTWNGSTPLLTSDFVERTAKITEIRIRPDVEFFEVNEKFDENGYFLEYEYKPITSGYAYPSPEYVTIQNPVVSDDPLSPYEYEVFRQTFVYPSGSAVATTTTSITIGLTDNLRAIAFVREPRYTTGTKSFYVKSYSVVMKVEGVKNDFPETTTIYGETNDAKKKFSYKGNELFQTTTFYGDNQSGYRLDAWTAEGIIENFKNGKETATIRCSISDYFDGYGNKIIDVSSERMTFDIYDVVTPYVKSETKEDIPLSSQKNGNPKNFIVVGLKFIYDGAVWQELTLQEV
jgi:hypothetical protein